MIKKLFNKVCETIGNIYNLIVYHSITVVIEIILVGVFQVYFLYGDIKIYLLVFLLGFSHRYIVSGFKLLFDRKEVDKN